MTERSEQKRLVTEGFRRWFRTPSRRHGEVEYSREVSFLELFYDLVYVVLIAQIAHLLAENVNWPGVRDFAIVFGLIWLAWMNGTLWHELHSREDGRSRNYIFIQMMLLALLAVFAGEATGDDGSAFAITYAVLFSLYTWQWYMIHRIDDPQYHRVTYQYLAAMVLTVSATMFSAFVDDRVRQAIWATVVIAWVVGGFFRMRRDGSGTFSTGVTSSLVERFGLFTIIVLGEVVVGVVEGIGEAEDQSIRTVATGIIALHIGYGFWWNYFDTLGRRLPAAGSGQFPTWFFSHLPLTMAIAGAGAAMVSLVEHAADTRAPAPTAWLLTGSVTVVLAGIVFAARALSKDEFPAGMLNQLAPTLALAAAAVLIIGAARPAPIVLVTAVGALLYLTWFRMFALYLAGGGRLRSDVDGGLATD